MHARLALVLQSADHVSGVMEQEHSYRLAKGMEEWNKNLCEKVREKATKARCFEKAICTVSDILNQEQMSK